MNKACQCTTPNFCTSGTFDKVVYCGTCFLPIRIQSVEEVLQRMNNAYFEKHREKLGEVKPCTTPKDGTIPQVLIDDANKFANRLDETQVKEATTIEERRSYLAWIQTHIGELTPRQYLYAGIGAALIFAFTKLQGC